MQPLAVPDTTPIHEAPANASCVTCDGPLDPGQRLRCRLCVEAARLCVEAARLAVERAGGRTVLPSDVAGIRERTAPSD